MVSSKILGPLGAVWLSCGASCADRGRHIEIGVDTASAGDSPIAAGSSASAEQTPARTAASGIQTQPTSSTEVTAEPESTHTAPNPELDASTSSTATVDTLPAAVAELIQLEPKKSVALKQKVNNESNCSANLDPQADACNLELSCGGAQSKTSCNLVGETWYCYCLSETEKVNYDLKTDNVALACAAGIGYCRPSAAKLLAEPTCDAAPTSVQDLNCSKRKTCSRSVQLDPSTNVHILTSDHLFVCKTTSDVMRCGCSDIVLGGLTPDDPNPATACDALIDACFEYPTAPTTGFECGPAIPRGTSDTCSSRFVCGNRVEINGTNPGLTNSTDRYLKCNTWSDDTAFYECSCSYNGARSFDFRVKLSDVCAYGNELCRAASTLEVSTSGTLSCDEPVKSFNSAQCNYSTRCSISGTANGLAATFADRLHAECLPNGSQWDCSCLSTGSQTLFQLNAADSTDACTQAYSRCTAAARLVYVDARGITLDFPSP